MSRQAPPKWAEKFFKWYCDPRFEEQILGDLEEQFEEDRNTYGLAKAKQRFAWNVIRFFRKGIIKPASGAQKLNYYGMLRNDIKTSLRIIKREKLYSTVNILGLSSGFVIAILILIYVQFESSYESYNPEADKVVRITMDYLDGETLIDQDCETYHPLGPMIEQEFPEVVDFTRAFDFQLGFEINGKAFKEPYTYAVDQSFLSMFGYRLIHGNAQTALKEPNQVVLTESAAMKFFGKTDVVGEFMGEDSALEIVGVINDSPQNTHLKFNVLMSYETMAKDLNKRENPWNSNDTYTYLKLSSADAYPTFQANLAHLSERLGKEDFIPDERIISEKIEDIHLYSDKSFEPEQNGSATIVFFLLGVALLVIVIAVLNYINLSTAKAMDRAKEAGIRKVVGSSVMQLRLRFFVESVLLNLISGILALAIILVVFDAYKALAGLPLEYSILDNPNNLLLFSILLVISTFLSGIFPAFALGSFKPMNVLKGKFSHSKSGIVLRKVLVVVQFSIAIFLLIQTFTADKQLNYMLNKDLGMNSERVVVISAPSQEGLQSSVNSFQNELLARPTFVQTGVSSTVPGLSTASMSSTTNINLDEDPRELKNNFFFYLVDSSFISTLEMGMLAGQDFTKPTSYKNPIIVNEEALRIWGVANAEEVVNKKSTFWGRENTIVGVVKNFHQLGAKSSHLPMIFVKNSEDPDYISVRLAEGAILQQIEELEDVYQDHFPNAEMEYFFLDQNFEKQYRADQQFQQIFNVLSAFAILITCLGLFGLASFTVAKRTKEIGIRKVLGASVSQVIKILSADFVKLVAISSVIAIPVTWYLVNGFLSQYSFRIEVDAWLFLLPTVFVLMVAFVTVFSKAFQASNINPVKALRDE
ncbi:MAG: ABC transporter permease [Ekhidna sp.]|nr:ABC transporter permease [Ekhidna sp.]